MWTMKENWIENKNDKLHNINNTRKEDISLKDFCLEIILRVGKYWTQSFFHNLVKKPQIIDELKKILTQSKE